MNKVEIEASIARRFASIARWNAIGNYMVMYPETAMSTTDSDLVALEFGDDTAAVLDHIAGRIEMHAVALRGLVNQLRAETGERP